MNAVYEKITQQIIDQLEQGTIPWRRPWSVPAPRNLVSNQPYRGLNALLLAISPYNQPEWVTFKQAQAQGGTVRKGERGTPIIFWSITEKRDDAGELIASFPILRSWTVFNVEQCDGLSITRTTAEPAALPDIEAVIAAVPNPPTIRYAGGQAFYAPAQDLVQMPPSSAFESLSSFYSTLFHELAHATGHRSRLNRPLDCLFGSASYAREELTAELAAALVCGSLSIPRHSVEQSAAYCQSWIDALKGDSRLLLNASSAATKAADYLLNRAHVDAAAQAA